jgi:MoaA/NifB/PqqE/SkfB family radical SAM enzyme
LGEEALNKGTDMPEIRSRKMVVMVDMAGCPNRCRHCWLGNSPNRRVSENTLRWIVQQFREWVRPGESVPFVEALGVFTWYREPDFSPNYRELWELEKELSDPGEARRFELLSIWRLARDESYARWARDIGTEKCQITFFGLEENTDYFTRRRGAFKDSLLATERLLEVGILPRWQVFLTTRSVPELEDFVALIDDMRLEEQARAPGSEFEVFAHAPSPTGEAFHIEHLRPAADVLYEIPEYLAEKSMQHFDVTTLEECFGKAESDWLPDLLCDDAPYAEYPSTLGFMVTPALDVFSNVEEPMPWWRLGNLDSDGIASVMQRFQNDAVPGLDAHFCVPVSQLALTYGRKDSRLLYGRGDLISRWVRMWAESRWKMLQTNVGEGLV